MTTNPPHTAWKALHVPEHLPALLRDAFAAQQAAFAKHRYPSLQERRADLRALHRLLVENRAALLDAVNADFGCRSHFETLATELLQGQEAALDAMRQLPRWMKKQKRHLDITQYPLASAYVLPQPVGVVGIVAPWNFPIAMVVQPLIGALAAGNRAMVKMSENSARTARLLQKLLPQYFPADKVCLFADDDAGPGQPLGPLFTQLPFNHLFFTGSPQTGRAVMANAAAHLTPVTLELGGKSPTIVAPDYPLQKAAERILWVKMLNAGQICTNVDYLFLPAGQEQAFIDHARRILAQRYPDLLNGDYTAIIDRRQYERLQAMLADAIAQGAQAVPLLPGQAGDAARRIMPPVALLNVHDGMQVMQREIFGPLLPILPYQSKEEVIGYINDRPHPLALYLFSEDKALQKCYLEQTLSGGVTINDTLLHAGQHALPFGGVGNSGMGHYHGYEGFLTFSKLRPVFQQGVFRSVDFLMPPYKGLATRMLNMMLWRNR
ncbi:MAG: coniferyl aldehyde dehydrogenase [Proteobacteria bacterium]|nr:coniferyl aldehyde dehydrogenase [Burkholderiales bacterium]MCA0311590.1 coniferyl aldehyde dehydrogenase [Pseudomonadota bacterium]